MCKQRVIITGYSSFLAKHIREALSQSDNYTIAGVTKAQFEPDVLARLLPSSDIVIHLAGVSRLATDSAVYATNIAINTLLLDALKTTDSRPRIIFISSTHETSQTGYGRSKHEGCKAFMQWASQQGASALAVVAPNLFGPFARVGYTSVVANFCDAIAEDSRAKIIDDTLMTLLYAPRFAQQLQEMIASNAEGKVRVPGHQIYVSDLLVTLERLSQDYQNNSSVPVDLFERELLITYLYYSLLRKRAFPQQQSALACKPWKIESEFVVLNGQSFCGSNNHRDLQRLCFSGGAGLQIRLGHPFLDTEIDFELDRTNLIDILPRFHYLILNQSARPVKFVSSHILTAE